MKAPMVTPAVCRAELTFRPAQDADLPLLLRLMAAYYAEDGHAFHPERAERALRTAAGGDPTCSLFVLEKGDAAVGYLAIGFGFSLESGGRDACLDELYLRPEARGHGHGSQALAFAESFAAQSGAGRLYLEVTDGNAHAQRLYSKHGFAAHGRRLMSKSTAPAPTPAP